MLLLNAIDDYRFIIVDNKVVEPFLAIISYHTLIAVMHEGHYFITFVE